MTETLTRVAATVGAWDLLMAVTDANRALAKRPVVPVLTGLKLSVGHGGRLHITGFDYELRVTRMVPVDGTIPDVLVNGATLLKAIKNLDKNQPIELTVTAAEGDLVLTQGKRTITLAPLPLDQYPDLPEVNTQRSFTLTDQQLTFLAEKVQTFSGRDDMLPVLNRTVKFDVVGQLLTAGSTNRFQAALAEIPVRNLDGEFHFLITDVARFAPAFTNAGDVYVGVKDEWVSFVSTDTIVTTRPYPGEFPKLASLFPTETNLSTDFDPIVLGKALKFVTLAVERNTAVALEVDTDHITLTGGGEHSDSRLSDTVPADVYGRDVDLGLEVGFNPDFLADVLRVFGKHRVTMRTVNNAKPGLFTSDAVPGFRVLLMPRKLHKED